jgi:hypothetical protein
MRQASAAARDPSSWTHGASAAWLLSFSLHAAALIGLGASGQRQPQGAAAEPTREGGVVLVARSADKTEYIGDSTTADSQAGADIAAPPALLPSLAEQPAVAAPQLPMSDVVPASATVAGSGSATPSATAASFQTAPTARGPSHGVETQIFGVKGKGSRFVYVFDRSSSMEGGPLSAAKRELIASLQSLQSVHQFQIIFYNQDPQLMPEFRGGPARMVFADEPGKRLAASFVGSISAFGATDHVKALHQALQLRPDVVFFLTDADEPQLTIEDFRRIRQWNQGTLINAIEFGVGPPKTRFNFLVKLADDNGGQHTYVDVTRLVR